MARVALDAMGGDRAPSETVAGAAEAASDGIEVTLVGQEPQLRQLLDGTPMTVVHAPETVEMDEDPARAVREKRESSVAVTARLVAEGKADAMVSAGSTGAALAAAAMIIGRLPGVHRPAIAVVLPTGERGKIVIDGGANPECKPEHLRQFAIMGSALAETRLGIEEPRVGLLNIGEEPGKGRDLERAAYGLLETAPINFVGNVEGRDLATARADVVVADGFAGNIAVKATEITAVHVGTLFNDQMLKLADDHPELGPAIKASLQDVWGRIHYDTYGGANLVGVKGVVTIAHGSASRSAIASAIRMSADEVERRLIEKIARKLES